MGERGQVLSVDGEELVIRMERTEACAKCKACIAGMSRKEMLLRAKNLCGAGVNDWVNIELETDFFLKSVLIMYGLPLIGMCTGFAAGYYGSRGFASLAAYAELIGFVLGILLMLGVYRWIKSKENLWKSKNVLPVATDIVDLPAVR